MTAFFRGLCCVLGGLFLEIFLSVVQSGKPNVFQNHQNQEVLLDDADPSRRSGTF